LECLKWVFLKNNKYRKIKRKKGINEIKRFLKYILEIIKGNISKIIDGEFKIDRSKVKSIPTSISLKNSNSDKTFKINTKLNMTKNT